MKIGSGGTVPSAAQLAAARLKVVGVVAFYFVVSIGLVLLNKVMFSSRAINLEAPLFLTWTQIVVAVGWSAVASSLNGYSLLGFFPSMEYDLAVARRVAPLTLLFIGMIACNNLCLKYVEISFYQVARALTIPFNLVFTYLWLGKPTSRRAVMACAVIVVGYLIGCDGEVNFSVIGVVFGVASSAFVCLYSVYVKEIMPVVGGNHWRLMIYNNTNALLLMPVLIVASGEVEAVRQYENLYTPFFAKMVLLAGTAGFFIGIATYMQINVTSPLTHNVSGTAKACVQTVIGVAIYRNPVSGQGAFGTFLSILGCGLYSVVRYFEMESDKAAEADSKDRRPATEMTTANKAAAV